MLAVRKVRRKLRMGTICSPNPSGTKTSSEACNADWMASLPPHLHNVPLSHLAIPGILFLLVPTVFASAILVLLMGWVDFLLC